MPNLSLDHIQYLGLMCTGIKGICLQLFHQILVTARKTPVVMCRAKMDAFQYIEGNFVDGTEPKLCLLVIIRFRWKGNKEKLVQDPGIASEPGVLGNCPPAVDKYRGRHEPNSE